MRYGTLWDFPGTKRPLELFPIRINQLKLSLMLNPSRRGDINCIYNENVITIPWNCFALMTYFSPLSSCSSHVLSFAMACTNYSQWTVSVDYSRSESMVLRHAPVPSCGMKTSPRSSSSVACAENNRNSATFQWPAIQLCQHTIAKIIAQATRNTQAYQLHFTVPLSWRPQNSYWTHIHARNHYCTSSEIIQHLISQFHISWTIKRCTFTALFSYEPSESHYRCTVDDNRIQINGRADWESIGIFLCVEWSS